jgi:hypothetical protein
VSESHDLRNSDINHRRRVPDDVALPSYLIVIDYISEGDVANLLRGYVIVGDQKIRFTGVAYGRFGGQNVSPSLSPAERKKAKKAFGDVEEFEEDLQLRLVRGDFGVKPGSEKHSHEHM